MEEFDYSESKYRNPVAKKRDVNKSKDETRSPTKDVNKSRNENKSPPDNSFQVDEIDYSIPLPTVPLNDILPGFGNKAKSPSKGIDLRLIFTTYLFETLKGCRCQLYCKPHHREEAKVLCIVPILFFIDC